ncbi:MAG TPA: PKD domain-containing protein [Chitinophagaceae bacterium]
MKFIFLLLFFVPIFFAAGAQDFSNKGKDFWVVYSAHIDGTASRMALYITSDVNASGTVDVNGTTKSFSVTANQVTTVQLTTATSPSNTIAYNGQVEGISSKKGIHIISNNPVVVYSHILNQARSGSTLVLPTNVLGKEYYVSSYKSIGAGTGKRSEFDIVATEDNSTIEITPTNADASGIHTANTPYQITLSNKGDVYQYQSNEDLTGTHIRSIGTLTGACQRIGVFSGSTWTAMGCNNAGSGDNLYQEMFPYSSWGKTYYTAPFINRAFDIFRIIVQDPTALVYINGVALNIASLQMGRFYEINTTGNNTARVITSNKPICVLQYMITMGCDGSNTSDPEMVILNSIEQTLNDITVMSARSDLTPPSTNITSHYLNVILKTSDFPTLRIDGNPPIANPVIITGTPYSYIQENVTSSTNINPAHRVTSDSGFICIAYGYGNVESYGYNAGTNVKDLLNFVTPINPLNISNQNTACAGTPFYFSITYPFQPTSLFWDFHGYQSPNVTVSNPQLENDTTYFVNGKQIWRYVLPGTYTYSPAGNYPVSITAGTSGSDGCGNLQTRDDTLFVYNPPVTDITWTHSGCATDSVFFKDNTNYVAGTFSYKWYWDFGDGKTDNVRNPKHLYTTPGIYTVRFSLISNVGCLSDTASKQIIITSAPAAKFGISTPNCIGKSITFTDQSTAPAPGNLVKWYWDFGDGITQTLTTSSNPTHIYSSTGVFNVTLKVENNTGCQSPVFTMPVNVHPNPVVNFNLPGICLPTGLAQFFDSSTIADGSQSLFTYLWNFGDAASGGLNNSVIKNPIHNYNNTGPFTINLQVTSNNGCISDTTKILSSVYAQPKAAFTVKAENCLNDTTYFTDQSNGQGSTIINWFWNFGDGQSSTLQNSSHIYSAVGSYTISLYIKTDKGCISDTATKQVIINSLPTASFATSTPACETKDVTFSNASAANSGILTIWNWNLGDGTLLTPPNDNTFTHTYSSAGNYTVTLSVQSDKGCKSPVLSRQIIINPQPVPGFIAPSVCLTDAFAQFTDTSKIAAGTITTWAWNFDDPSSGALNTSALQNPKHKYNAIGIYNVTLTVTSNNGCVATLTKAFTVNGAVPKANFTVLNSTGLCSNTNVQLQNTSTVDFGNITKVEIYWDLTNAPAAFDADLNPTPNKIYTHLYLNFQSPLTKTFQVKFRSYSGINCVDEITKSITVNASPKVQFLSISDTCFNINPFAITQASEIGGVPGTGAFSGPGITGSNIFDPSVAGVGTHTIRYTFTSNAGCVDYQDQTITIYPIVNVNAGPDRAVLEAASITLEPIVTGNALQYLWTPNQYLNDATILTPTVLGVQDITYTLSVTGTGGCIFSDQVFVKVLKFPNVPNTFTPNNDGINDTWVIDHLADYPNVRVQVFNRYGQLVFESKGYTKPWDGTMNGKSLPFGTYYYVIEPGNGRNPVTGYVTLIK